MTQVRPNETPADSEAAQTEIITNRGQPRGIDIGMGGTGTFGQAFELKLPRILLNWTFFIGESWNAPVNLLFGIGYWTGQGINGPSVFEETHTYQPKAGGEFLVDCKRTLLPTGIFVAYVYHSISDGVKQLNMQAILKTKDPISTQTFSKAGRPETTGYWQLFPDVDVIFRAEFESVSV